MKTGQYYFDKLSEVEQNNYEESFNNDEDKVETLKKRLRRKHPAWFLFFSGAFAWNRTNQGHDYWLEIANRKVD